ncbi:unnamed protein product [Candidula unifasciata]|uniref:Apyrase n=1 Tax=Candidula unifasciata TaxID=100452 RepID=A0A8S3YZ20_9EUPU|nr:unnamed protein product [Candidula unifasciata]
MPASLSVRLSINLSIHLKSLNLSVRSSSVCLPIYRCIPTGLRFLKPHVSGQLIKNIIEIFDNFHINHFRGREGIAVLSGEEEAAYSWVAANYLLGKFARNRTDWETVGLLEMGGGSTQIAFVPKQPIYSGEFQININGRPYDLYVHSYLQFGINAVQVWVAKVLSQLYPDSHILGNPCMLKGDVKEIEVENKQTLLLHGTSDPEGCKRIFKQILAPEKGLKCEPKPCAVGNVYQPSVDDIKFYAIQGFTLAPKAFNVLGPDQILDIDLLEQEAFKYCRKNLSEAVQAGIDESVASTTCLMGIYTPSSADFLV